MANGYFTNLFQNWHLSIYKKRLLVRRFNTLGGLHVILQMTTILLFGQYIPSEEGSTVKGKNLLPRGANSFPLK